MIRSLHKVTVELRKSNHKTKLTSIETPSLYCGTERDGLAFRYDYSYNGMLECTLVKQIYRYYVENGKKMNDFNYKVNRVCPHNLNQC